MFAATRCSITPILIGRIDASVVLVGVTVAVSTALANNSHQQAVAGQWGGPVALRADLRPEGRRNNLRRQQHVGWGPDRPNALRVHGHDRSCHRFGRDRPRVVNGTSDFARARGEIVFRGTVNVSAGDLGRTPAR